MRFGEGTWGKTMKIGFYPLRDWAWLWIALGAVLPAGAAAMNGTWPQPELFLWSLVIMSFGAIGAPALKGILDELVDQSPPRPEQ